MDIVDNSEEILKNLDADQIKAVTGTLNTSLIEAVAGSGKTTTLTRRIAYIIEHYHVRESQIWLLTFTNKAAESMINKTKKILHKDNLELLAGTFHHAAAHFLRKYSSLLGFNSNFNILSQEDSKEFISSLRAKFLASNKEFGKFPDTKIIYDFYSKNMNFLMDFDEINVKYGYDYSPQLVNAISDIIKNYKAQKIENQSMDFDDLIYYFYVLLKDFPQVREKIASHYSHVYVDEVQDLNYHEYQILSLVQSAGALLYVIGDYLQAIYQFRGSDSKYIQNFDKTFKNCSVYPIRYNYRSSEEILAFATDFLKSYDEGKNVLIPVKGSTEKPVVTKVYDEVEQAQQVVDIIKKRHGKGLAYNEIAVLLRIGAQSKDIEMALRRESIPYTVLCGISFFERQHVRDVISFLKFYENEEDGISFTRMTKLFDGIGDKTSQRFYLYLKSIGFDYDKAKEYNIPFKVSSTGFNSIQTILDILTQFKSCPSICDMINVIMDKYYKECMQYKFDNFRNRMEDIDSLMSTAKLYSSVQAFLEDLMLDKNNKDKEKETEEGVCIMTMHKSKGLEYSSVIIPYAIESSIPYYKSVDEGNIEGEINLWYVSITRAKLYLDILYPEFTYRAGFVEPSRFLDCIDESLYVKKEIEHSCDDY